METRNIRLTIQYDGTRYLGWQKLGARGSGDYGRTIQGKLETVLSKMTGEEIELNGSGRTDAGVHAAGQVASFRTACAAEPAEIAAYLNRYLPEDIAVTGAEEAPPRFHARLHAKRKVYRYDLRVSPVPDVFRGRFEYRIDGPLDIAVMRAAAEALTGTRDFRHFSSAKRTKKSTVRTVDSIALEEAGERLSIVYTGDGFLYNMVRILTGTLIEIGRGERSAAEIGAMFSGALPPGYTAPARGLTLVRVEY